MPRVTIWGLIISDNNANAWSWSDPAVLWGTLFGVGWLPKAPGTWGSIVAAVIWWFFLAELNRLTQVSIVAIYFLSGWWAASQISRRYHVDDAAQIVADEVAGLWLGLVWAPKVWWVLLLVFVAFRILDIFKPGPIGWLDRNVHGGIGVMADDFLAGFCIAVCLILVGEAGWL